MAGEKFIALEETSQQIKASVETVSTSVNEIKGDVGDGAGTDLVSRVAQLQAKVDQLLSKGNGEIKYKRAMSIDDIKKLSPNKEFKLIVLPKTYSNYHAYITLVGSVYFNGIEIDKNRLSGNDYSFMMPFNVPFTFKYTDKDIISSQIKEAGLQNCYLFEIE